MAQYDGSIRINTNISTKDARAQLGTLQYLITKTADEIASLRSKMDALKDQKVPTERYKQLQEYIDNTKASVVRLTAQMKRMEADGLQGSNVYNDIANQIGQMEDELKKANARMKELVENGKAFTLGKDTDEYKNLAKQLENEQKALKKMAAQYVALGGLTTIKKANIAFRKLGDVAKNAFSRITKSAKRSGGAISLFGAHIKSLAVSALIFNQIRKAFNSISSAISTGFGNLYKDLDGFKNSVDSLKASLLTLKNSFAAAFRPLVEVALPYIQMVADAMSNLLDMVGQFTAAITGQKTYTKAIKQTTAALEDQNKAQGKQLSGLDKLNNLTSKNGAESADTGAGIMFQEVTLPSKFIDIAEWFKNMWEDADFTELGAAIGDKFKNALQSINWESIKKSAENLAKRIATFVNGAIETEGFGYSIGNTLAQEIDTAFEFLSSFVHIFDFSALGSFIADNLNGFFDNIDWDLIKDTFVTGFRGLASSINSFIANFRWDNISNSISSAVNTLSGAIYAFFSSVKWDELGKSIGGQLIETVRKIDFKEVGRAIGSVIQAAFDFLVNFVKTLNLKDVAQAIIDAIKGFFSEVDFKDFALVVGSLIAASLAKNIVIGTFASTATGIGTKIGSALTAYALPAILSAVAGWNLGELIGRKIFGDEAYDNFSWNDFFDALKVDYGVVIKEPVIRGLKAGEGLININFSNDNLKGLKETVSVANTLALGFSESANTIKDFVKEINDAGEKVLGFVEETKNKWKSYKVEINDIVNGLSKKISDSFINIFSDILKKTENFMKNFKNKLSNLSNVFSAVGNFTSSFVSGIASTASHTNVPIPKLATGAVIPANKEFLAVLGDQKHGTNIEAPLDTIRQANEEAILNVFSKLGISTGNSGRSGNETFVFQIDGETFFKIMRKHAEEHFNCTGQSAFPI